ncbi:MAG: hypothetical protein R8K53_01090 [Mariprofundaceae bacterium]
MRKMVFILGFLLVGLSQQAMGGDNARKTHTPLHGGGESSSVMQHKEGFITIKGIEDDYSVIFHIMRAPQGSAYSRQEYHLMVSIEKNGKPRRGLAVQSTVRHPNGEIDDLAEMVKLNGWHLARYNLNHEQGQHRVSVHFEVAGKKYSSHIYYPEYIGQ